MRVTLATSFQRTVIWRHSAEGGPCAIQQMIVLTLKTKPLMTSVCRTVQTATGPTVMGSRLVCRLMPCLYETRLREVNWCHFTIENVARYNRNVNVLQINVSRVNTAISFLMKALFLRKQSRVSMFTVNHDSVSSNLLRSGSHFEAFHLIHILSSPDYRGKLSTHSSCRTITVTSSVTAQFLQLFLRD